MSDFPKECIGYPFQTGDFELTKVYVDSFVCQCDCLSNCSYYDYAKEFVGEMCGQNK